MTNWYEFKASRGSREAHVAVLCNVAKVKKELLSEKRVQIKTLFHAGWSYPCIAKDLRFSPSTVKHTLDRHDVTNSHQNRKGSSANKKLSDRQQKHLKILSLKDWWKTSRELHDELNTATKGAPLSLRTVRGKLGEEGLGRIAPKTPEGKKLWNTWNFAKEHKKWSKEDEYKVWTAESTFERLGNRQRVYVRWQEGERYKSNLEKNLLYIQRKAFGMSFRRHGITLAWGLVHHKKKSSKDL